MRNNKRTGQDKEIKEKIQEIHMGTVINTHMYMKESSKRICENESNI